jgi:hypothetical protein
MDERWGRTLGTWLASFLLLAAVAASLGTGIVASYGVMNAILFAFRPRIQSQPEPAPVLVARAAAGSGD